MASSFFSSFGFPRSGQRLGPRIHRTKAFFFLGRDVLFTMGTGCILDKWYGSISFALALVLGLWDRAGWLGGVLSNMALVFVLYKSEAMNKSDDCMVRRWMSMNSDKIGD